MTEPLRDRIRAAKPPEAEALEVPEWDVIVEVRSMSVVEKGALAVMASSNGDTDAAAQYVEYLPRVVIATCFDPTTGEPVFGEDDREWLASQPAAIVERLAVAGTRVSGLAEGALDVGKGAS